MATTATSIRDRIEADINAGVRRPGERLPPVRTLATELNVSPNTVAAAYKQLRGRGAVTGRGRQGTIVAPLSRPTFSQLTPVPDGVIDALRGSPDPRLLPELAPAFAAATNGLEVGYGEQLVDDGFAATARDMFERDGVGASNLTVTSGAMDAIEKILSANDLRPGDRVGVEDPGHIPVHQLVRARGLQLVPLAIDSEGIMPDSLSKAFEQNLAALIVTPRAQNPTGAALTQQRAAELSNVLSNQPDTLLIQDDHAGAISGADWIPLTPPGDRHAIIRSLGKSLGPDLRISVTVGDATTVDRVSVAISNGPGWVSHILQRAAAHLLTDKATVKLVAKAEQSYADRRTRLISALAAYGVDASGPSGINVWIPANDEQAIVEAARSGGFAIRAADSYRIESRPAVRVTIANLSREQIDSLASVIATASKRNHSSPAM